MLAAPPACTTDEYASSSSYLTLCVDCRSASTLQKRTGKSPTISALDAVMMTDVSMAAMMTVVVAGVVVAMTAVMTAGVVDTTIAGADTMTTGVAVMTIAVEG